MPINNSALRRDLVEMLLFDRQSALHEHNAGAAVQASSRVVDLLLGRLAEEAKDVTPVTQLTHVIVYQSVCPICKGRGPITAAPPSPAFPEPVRARRASGWDDEPGDEAGPAPEPVVRQLATIAVPKTPEQMRHRRDRDTQFVKGLA